MKPEQIINAQPSKEFFIDMITRDIRLDRAIIDLIDNSIDGARSIRESEDYEGLKIEIKLSENKFEIIDNCGGFSLTTAMNYAFKFGRPQNAIQIKHSTGRFGIGMKRALFKMGKKCIIESKHGKDHFIVEVNVDKWLQDPNKWSFSYKKNTEVSASKLSKDGTAITITNLFENVSSDFSDNQFVNKLLKEISLALSYSLLKKIRISVNGQNISRTDISLLESNELKPLFEKLKFPKVEARIYAGLGNYSPVHAGWYIFCNDRLVLEADKSYLTGWKESKEDSNNIIKYHNDFAMFRGVVFFDAADSSELPMTTTKTGIDSDHPIYKGTRPHMLIAMKQITKYLRKIEKEEGEAIINNSSIIDITDIRKHERKYSADFRYPNKKSILLKNNLVTISYQKESKIVEQIKELAGVSSNKQVGEITFEYFVKMNK